MRSITSTKCKECGETTHVVLVQDKFGFHVNCTECEHSTIDCPTVREAWNSWREQNQHDPVFPEELALTLDVYLDGAWILHDANGIELEDGSEIGSGEEAINEVLYALDCCQLEYEEDDEECLGGSNAACECPLCKTFRKRNPKSAW